MPGTPCSTVRFDCPECGTAVVPVEELSIVFRNDRFVWAVTCPSCNVIVRNVISDHSIIGTLVSSGAKVGANDLIEKAEAWLRNSGQ